MNGSCPSARALWPNLRTRAPTALPAGTAPRRAAGTMARTLRGCGRHKQPEGCGRSSRGGQICTRAAPVLSCSALQHRVWGAGARGGRRTRKSPRGAQDKGRAGARRRSPAAPAGRAQPPPRARRACAASVPLPPAAAPSPAPPPRAPAAQHASAPFSLPHAAPGLAPLPGAQSGSHGILERLHAPTTHGIVKRYRLFACLKARLPPDQEAPAGSAAASARPHVSARGAAESAGSRRGRRTCRRPLGSAGSSAPAPSSRPGAPSATSAAKSMSRWLHTATGLRSTSCLGRHTDTPVSGLSLPGAALCSGLKSNDGSPHHCLRTHGGKRSKRIPCIPAC